MIRQCLHCGTRNRIPAKHLADQGRCGKCREELPPLSEPVDADPATFTEITRDATVPVMVDFWAPWCGPCRTAAPEVARAAANLAGKAIVLKVDTEQHPTLAAHYAIRSIPNFAVFSDGVLREQRAGLMGHQELAQFTLRAATRTSDATAPHTRPERRVGPEARRRRT